MLKLFLFLSIILFSFGISACSHSNPIIIMETGMCECPYPVRTYSVVFENEPAGKVHLTEEIHYNPSKKNEWTYSINPDSVRRLQQEFAEMHFMQLDSEYIRDRTFDLGSTTISYISDNV